MPLTAKQVQELGGLMDARRRALQEELHEDVERARTDRFEELAGAARDSGDESVATLIGDLDHADVSRDLAELRALDAARQRMDRGGYGACADCGSEIELERLRAEPAALRCIGCQRMHEKTYAGPAGSSL